MLHIVIMAGGAGTRFWPESRAKLPKQLLPLAGERTMLQMTVDRLGLLAGEQNVWVLTGAGIINTARKQLPRVPYDHMIGEPCKRDTAPCIGLAALLIARKTPNAIMAVMPADQVISPDGEFQRCMSAAATLVGEKQGRIVTFGILPTYAATTFGYIERGERLHSTLAKQTDATSLLDVYQVARFREKPPAEIAKEYVDSGNFYWNSGIFVWSAATIISAMDQRQPETMQHLRKIVAAWDGHDAESVFAREFAEIKGISIDYAVMEQASDVAVIEAPFAWSDVGSWQAAAKTWPVKADEQGNTATGKCVAIDTKNSILRTDDKHLIAALGVNDLIIVHTPDATLVANRHDEESIRKITKLLEERGWKEYL
jgi:mannose-1-phosphate guanylyltransferase